MKSVRLDGHIVVVAAAMVVVAIPLRGRLHQLPVNADTVSGYAALVALAVLIVMAATRAFDMWRTNHREAAMYLGQNVGFGMCVAAFLAFV